MNNNNGNDILDGMIGKSVEEIIRENMNESNILSLKQYPDNIIINNGEIIFPNSFNTYIMSVILWCSLPLDHIMNNIPEENNVLYDRILRLFNKLLTSIKEDAVINFFYTNIWNEVDGHLKTIHYTDEFYIQYLPFECSLVYPIKDLNIHKNFISYCNTLKISNINLAKIYPALFLQWLNCYNPQKNSIPPNQYDKLLLTLLLPARSEMDNAEFDKRIEEKIDSELSKPYIRKSEDKCKSYFEEIYGNKCDKTCNIQEMKLCLDKMINESKVLLSEVYDGNIDLLYDDDDFANGSEYYYSYQDIIESKQDAYWNIMYKYAQKTENRKLKNPICYKNIYALKEIFDILNKNSRGVCPASKPLSLLHLNKSTKWVDLIFINNDLLISAIYIDGLQTKHFLSEFYNRKPLKCSQEELYYSQSNYIKYKKKFSSYFQIQDGEYFMQEFTEGINNIILSTTSKLSSLAKSDLNILEKKYKNSYENIYDKYFNENYLKNELSKESIVKLAQYLYNYQNNISE